MPNQNDNRIEALKEEAEALNTLTREFQNKLNAFDIDEQDLLEQRLDEEANEKALAQQTAIETQQREIIDEIATLEAGIEEQQGLVDSLRKKRKAIQKKVDKAQAAKYLLQSRLKTQRGKLEKLSGELPTPEVYDEVVTVLPTYVDEGARLPTYHVGKTGTDLGPDWSDKWRDKRGNRSH